MTISKTLMLAACGLMMAATSWAGNPDRAGSAGAQHLLINPWARGGGLGNSNMASIGGVEATFHNVAGMAFTRKTEFLFTNVNYLTGSDINLNSFGFSQKLGESSTLGVTVNAMSFGENEITTVDLPDGGIGNFRPTNSVFGLHYAKAFSNSIYGGISVKVVTESIANVNSSGVAFDAGIQYVTGDRDNVHFGIALKNVGAPLKFSGDGLAVDGIVSENGFQSTVDTRVNQYELPSLVNIGFGYDFLLAENHELATSAQFISNSFTRDQFGFGAEYNFKERLMLRAGYQWEDKLGDDEESTNIFTGPAAGITLQIPAGANETVIGVDYSYRATKAIGPVHNIGFHINL